MKLRARLAPTMSREVLRETFKPGLCSVVNVSLEHPRFGAPSGGEKHFRSLRDAGEMERVFNEAPAERRFHCVNEVRRVLRGVALAGRYRRESLDETIDAYQTHYVGRWDAKRLVPKFDAMVALARSHTG